MSVKMIALGRYYDTATNKEYKDKAEFHVADDKTADRLVRIRKAKRAHPHVVAPAAPAVVEPVAPVEPPAPRSYTRRVLTPEPEVTNTPEPEPVAESSEPDPTAEVAKIPTSRLGRYRRNDMRSED